MAAPNIVNVATITGITTGKALDTTTTTNLVMNPASSGKVFKINSIIVANVDGSSAADVDVAIVTASQSFANTTVTGADATTYLAKTISVPADATLVVSDTPIYLREGDNLQAQASASGDLDLTITFELLTDA